VTVLSDRDIRREQGLATSPITTTGAVAIERDGSVAYQPSSVDLHVTGETLRQKPQSEPIRLDDQSTYPEYTRTHSANYIGVPAGEVVLATTEEYVSLDNTVVGFLWGRSSIGRLGLFAHNAGLVDAGYDGELTLELVNMSPNDIEIPVGTAVAQLTVHELQSVAEAGYDEVQASKYNGQTGPTPSRLYEDFEKSSNSSFHETNDTRNYEG
jgi:dCTP deaminase